MRKLSDIWCGKTNQEVMDQYGEVTETEVVQVQRIC